METEDCSAARHCSGKIMQSWIKKWPKDQTRPATVGFLLQPFSRQCMAKRWRSTMISLVRQAWTWFWWDEGQAKICRREEGAMHVRLDQRLEMHSCIVPASSFWVDNTDPYFMNAGYQESTTDCKFMEWILLPTAIYFGQLHCHSSAFPQNKCTACKLRFALYRTI